MHTQWIFVCRDKIAEQTRASVLSDINTYLSSWDSHGSLLDAQLFIYLDQILVIQTNDTVSGCAIDTLKKNVNSILETYTCQVCSANYIALVNKDSLFICDRKNVKECIKELDPENVRVLDQRLSFDSNSGIDSITLSLAESWLAD